MALQELETDGDAGEEEVLDEDEAFAVLAAWQSGPGGKTHGLTPENFTVTAGPPAATETSLARGTAVGTQRNSGRTPRRRLKT